MVQWFNVLSKMQQYYFFIGNQMNNKPSFQRL